MKKIIFDTLSSTQKYIKENNIDYNTYIIANNQTDGRGRTGNTWFSSSDNLMFSFKINVKDILLEDVSLITLLTGVSMRETLSIITNDNKFLIKWPNDIIYDDKKICGIIAEGIFNGKEKSIVIGIGVNVNQETFSEEINTKAISLKNIYSKSFDKDKILEIFDNEFKALFNKFINKDKSFINEMNKYNYLKDKEVLVNNDEYKNKKLICKEILDNGFIRLLDEKQNVFDINANEITLTNIYK